MNKLSDDERNPLRYYAETERIIHGPVRGTIIQRPVRGPFAITYSAWVTSKNGQSIHEAQLLY
jgi:hypothetical protein